MAMATIPSTGSQPRFMPFVLPVVVRCRARTPRRRRSPPGEGHHPPSAERKIRLAATMPRIIVWVRSVATQYSLKMSGASSASPTSSPPATRLVSREPPQRSCWPAEQPERPYAEHDRQQHEREDDRVERVVGREVGGGEVRCKAQQQRPDGGSSSDPMPPMITTTSELRSQSPSTPGARLANEPPITPMPASADPMKKAIANVSWMFTPGRRPCRGRRLRPDHHPGARALEPEPQRSPSASPHRG